MLVRIALFFIKLYQVLFSWIFNPCCRFLPTCSEYSAECFKHHGFYHGAILTIQRLLKCNPFGPYGYDPVIQKNSQVENVK